MFSFVAEGAEPCAQHTHTTWRKTTSPTTAVRQHGESHQLQTTTIITKKKNYRL